MLDNSYDFYLYEAMKPQFFIMPNQDELYVTGTSGVKFAEARTQKRYYYNQISETTTK